MRTIELNKDGVNGLEKRYFKNKTFSHVTGNQIKLLPFKTNPSGDTFSEDFKSFQGVIGELFRIINSKTQIELDKTKGVFKDELKKNILENALSKADTVHKEEFKNMVTKLFFDDENGLIKFNIKTLSYMNFINPNNAIKEVSRFIFDLFYGEDFNFSFFEDDSNNENLLHQLILQCLPDLPESTSKSKVTSYYNLFPEIKEQFITDFSYLTTNKDFLLKHIEDFLKYYYFHYLSQLIIRFKNFGVGSSKIVPVNYTMDWETLSETRLNGHTLGWKQLNRYASSVFAHINAIELLNYISIENKTIGDYNEIVTQFKDLSSEEQEKLEQCIDELITFYTDNITVFDTGKSWEDCKKQLELALYQENFTEKINKTFFSFWFMIKYQFENSSRNKPYNDYSKWYVQFGKVNYTKSRGRLGNSTVLSQELLLFLTKLCIGAEDKIRLKTLWDKLKDRGIIFDEATKLEVTKLFEKINLIEKKSDSGDAQYVKSTI
jgi:DNA phosphorothioation-dependent restriction protein DptG